MSFDYTIIEKLMKGKKILSNGKFSLAEKKSSTRWLIDYQLAKHDHLELDVVVYVEQSKIQESNFKFGLRCEDVFKPPFLRFDSDGPAHKNRNSDGTIEVIQTPHFNYFNEKGKNVAIQPDDIKLGNLKGNITDGFNYFCSFGVLTCDPDAIITKAHSEKLPLDPINFDPLADVIFK